MSGGQFDWGGRLLKSNGGAQRYACLLYTSNIRSCSILEGQYVSRILKMMSVRQSGAYSVRITGESVTFPYLILSGKRQSRTAGLPEVIFFVYLKFIRGKAY